MLTFNVFLGANPLNSGISVVNCSRSFVFRSQPVSNIDDNCITHYSIPRTDGLMLLWSSSHSTSAVEVNHAGPIFRFAFRALNRNWRVYQRVTNYSFLVVLRTSNFDSLSHHHLLVLIVSLILRHEVIHSLPEAVNKCLVSHWSVGWIEIVFHLSVVGLPTFFVPLAITDKILVAFQSLLKVADSIVFSVYVIPHKEHVLFSEIPNFRYLVDSSMELLQVWIMVSELPMIDPLESLNNLIELEVNPTSDGFMSHEKLVRIIKEVVHFLSKRSVIFSVF